MRIFGFGLGTFLLALLWVGCLITCSFTVRSKGVSGAIGPTLLASLITTILILLPKDDSNASVVPQTEEKKNIDNAFIPRVVLAVIMGLTALFSVGAIIVTHVFKIVRPKTVK